MSLLLKTFLGKKQTCHSNVLKILDPLKSSYPISGFICGVCRDKDYVLIPQEISPQSN
jgi:hypothetical protein